MKTIITTSQGDFIYRLTGEGKKYLKTGLPEERLIKIVKKPLTVAEARKKTPDFSIALSWAKKNKWVRIEKGKIVIVKKPTKIEEREALRNIDLKKPVGERMLRVLISRKLVEKVRKDSYKKIKKMAGKEVTTLSPELIKTGMWKHVKIKPYNVSVRGEKLYPGKRQPYNRFLLQVRQKLVELGFREMTGPVIESEFWNFDALFQAQSHPSRDWAQTYTLKKPRQGFLPSKKLVERVSAAHENGWKTGSTGWGYKWDPMKAANLMPRAHGTACSARQLARGVDVPGKYFAIKRCFRPDVIDATHGVEFNQCEGIIIDESLNFEKMLGILKMFAIEIAGAVEVRFYPDYYPFTEPSVQLSAKHPQLGWIEFAGAGIFRPELTEPLGVKQPVLAWGLGIDRLAMCKLGIKDIRHLFSQDIDWLRRQRVTV
ncbi:MAG: phenylalanine--tRNA ligase subunit alpha [Candidatus Aenigmatarchaeota archaeon]|nr:MAG: phenylalanine--tRNA ligase subunit alpha [Candidatus Aenigmarchaeota archaeon]